MAKKNIKTVKFETVSPLRGNTLVFHDFFSFSCGGWQRVRERFSGWLRDTTPAVTDLFAAPLGIPPILKTPGLSSGVCRGGRWLTEGGGYRSATHRASPQPPGSSQLATIWPAKKSEKQKKKVAALLVVERRKMFKLRIFAVFTIFYI